MTGGRHDREPQVSDSEPIAFRPIRTERGLDIGRSPQRTPAPPVVAFDRQELGEILNVYGRRVAAGDWRDYAIDMGRDCATFSVFRRASEVPIYRIEKRPALARKQGAFAVVTATGLILKRGNELSRVLAVIDKTVRLVD
jgi:hypothetical protein